MYGAVTAVDLDALNERAGAHSWGYVEPSEAAWELLEEAVEEWITDMKRKAELGFVAAAETTCIGIIEGLYLARNEQSDGALGWAPDFSVERAAQGLGELLRRPSAKRDISDSVLNSLTDRAPEWADMLRRVASEAAGR